jgi:hypothetical protein
MIDGVPMKILFEEIAESDTILFLSGSKRIVTEGQFHHYRYGKHSYSSWFQSSLGLCGVYVFAKNG